MASAQVEAASGSGGPCACVYGAVTVTSGSRENGSKVVCVLRPEAQTKRVVANVAVAVVEV